MSSLEPKLDGNEMVAAMPQKVERLLHVACGKAERVVEGGNNFACRMTSEKGPLFVKAYFHDPGDTRNRLKTEFTTLSFMWEQGLRSIPEPLAADETDRIGVYRHISGRLGREVELQWADVQQLADLLLDMWELRKTAKAVGLPAASDACFTLPDYADAVERRYAVLLDVANKESAGGLLRHFLTECFCPVWAQVKERLANEGEAGASRTLSPSDHGFHNAIRSTDGTWRFVDFEYAGWDDAPKMLADALHQPGVPLPAGLRRRFLNYVLSRMGDDGPVLKRFETVYPAVGLKWCLLMLNEFIPTSQRRRRYAGRSDAGGDQLEVQLRKAEVKLRDVTNILRTGPSYL